MNKQYVIQIQTEENHHGVGWLAVSFEVTPETPIPESWPDSREQIIMTNTASFNAIVEIYEEHTLSAVFSHDNQAQTINCSGAATGSWPIN